MKHIASIYCLFCYSLDMFFLEYFKLIIWIHFSWNTFCFWPTRHLKKKRKDKSFWKILCGLEISFKLKITDENKITYSNSCRRNTKSNPWYGNLNKPTLHTTVYRCRTVASIYGTIKRQVLNEWTNFLNVCKELSSWRKNKWKSDVHSQYSHVINCLPLQLRSRQMEWPLTMAAVECQL